MKSKIDKNVFFNLLNGFGAMGEENSVFSTAKEELKKFANVVREDINGNIIGTLGYEDAKYHILLDAHLDQVCLIITHICEGGFLKFSSCGGIDSRILPGKFVKIFADSRDISGIISSIPPHIEQRNADYLKKEELFIDTGLSEEEVRKSVIPGDRVTFASEAQSLLDDIVVSKSIDNRAGVITLLHFAKILNKENLKNTKISILLSNGEEINAVGAKTGTFNLEPDLAIALDVSFAKQPNVDEACKGKMGSGPMIGVSPCLSKKVYKDMIDVAKYNSIPFQIEVMPQKTGTNADQISVSKGGVETGLLSIPIRYMHTMSETVCLKDIEYTASLLKKTVSTYLR